MIAAGHRAAVTEEGAGAGDLAQQAAPFGEQPVDVAAADGFEFVHDVARPRALGHEGADGFAPAEAVLQGHTLVQPAVDREAPVGTGAGGGKRIPLAADEPGRV